MTPLLKSFIVERAQTKQGLLIVLIFFTISITYTAFNKFLWSFKSPGVILFLPYVGYYLAGYYLSVSNFIEKFTARKLITIFFLCSVLIALGMMLFTHWFGYMHYGRYFYSNFCPFVIAASVSLFLLFKKVQFSSKKVSLVSQKVLGIYLIHPFFLTVFLGLPINIHATISIPAVSIIVFIVSYWIVDELESIPFVRRIF